MMGIDLQTGQVANFSRMPGTYNEVEGIFPDGLYTTVESDRECERLGGVRGSGNIDIWKLRLDGTGKDFTRLTYFNDYEGGKASNPVISTDGRFMAFQSAGQPELHSQEQLHARLLTSPILRLILRDSRFLFLQQLHSLGKGQVRRHGMKIAENLG